MNQQTVHGWKTRHSSLQDHPSPRPGPHCPQKVWSGKSYSHSHTQRPGQADLKLWDLDEHMAYTGGKSILTMWGYPGLPPTPPAFSISTWSLLPDPQFPYSSPMACRSQCFPPGKNQAMLLTHLPCCCYSYFQVMCRSFSKNNRESKNLFTVIFFHTGFTGMPRKVSVPLSKGQDLYTQ